MPILAVSRPLERNRIHTDELTDYDVRREHSN